MQQSWPVLARLPRVGECVAGRREPVAAATDSEYFDADPYVADMAQLQAQTARASAAAFDATEPLREPPAREPSAATAGGKPAAPQWRRRIDPADHRGQPVETPAILRSAPSPAAVGESVAARVLQWHAGMTPNASAAVAGALVICTGLLCWLTFGRAPAPTATLAEPTSAALRPRASDEPPAVALEAAPDKASESAALPRPAVGVESSAVAAHAAAKSPAAPSVAAAKPLSSASEAESPVADTAALSAAATVPPVEQVAPPPPSETDSPAPVAPPAAPAAAAIALPYPVTPYVTFDFSPLLQGPAAVGRTADGMSADTTPR